jgi:hypothetical protein
MKIIIRNITFLLSGFFFFVSSNIYAQTKVSGFFDAVGVANFNETNKSKFLINQFELDFSYLHKSNFSVGSAITYNNESENIELAMAFIHYSFGSGPGKHPRRVETYNHSAFLLGKFDMPFGLDYLSYASIDRATITQPLVIEKTIAGWNDIGIDFHLFKSNFKFDVWAVNGFNEGIGLGGNIRYKLFPFFEIGVSHSADINSFNDVNDWLTGTDFRVNTEILEIKSELLWTEGVYEGAPDTVLNNKIHHGWYLQMLVKLKKWTSLPLSLTLRLGGWTCSDIENKKIDETQHRYTTAIAYKLHNNLSFRMELSTNKFTSTKTETLGFLQVVVGF